MIYFSVFQSLFTCGIIGWGGTAFGFIEQLARTQKIILKLVSNRLRRYSTEQLFNEYEVMLSGNDVCKKS